MAVVCFLIGSVNPAALVGRSLGHDLRTSGSGNPGATNAGRVLGRKWGVLVLVLDVAKAYLPTLLVLRTLGTVPALVAGLSVVLGHVFSPFLRGHGGKGAACALGAVLAVEPVGRARGGRRVRAGQDRPAVRRRGVGGHGRRHRPRRGARSGRAGAVRGAGRRGLARAALAARPVPPSPQHRRLVDAARAVTGAWARHSSPSVEVGGTWLAAAPVPSSTTRCERRRHLHRRPGAPRGGRAAILSVGRMPRRPDPESSRPGPWPASGHHGAMCRPPPTCIGTRWSPRLAGRGERSSRHGSRLPRWEWVRLPVALEGARWQPGRSAVLGVLVVTLLAVAVFGLRVAWAASDEGGQEIAPGGGSRAGPTGVTAGAAPVGVPAAAASTGIAGTGRSGVRSRHGRPKWIADGDGDAGSGGGRARRGTGAPAGCPAAGRGVSGGRCPRRGRWTDARRRPRARSTSHGPSSTVNRCRCPHRGTRIPSESVWSPRARRRGVAAGGGGTVGTGTLLVPSTRLTSRRSRRCPASAPSSPSASSTGVRSTGGSRASRSSVR